MYSKIKAKHQIKHVYAYVNNAHATKYFIASAIVNAIFGYQKRTLAV